MEDYEQYDKLKYTIDIMPPTIRDDTERVVTFLNLMDVQSK